MIKTLPLKVFSLNRSPDNINYQLFEFFLLLENLCKYKYSGYMEIKGNKYSFVILIDEGIPVSYVDITNNPMEISPIIFKYRVEEELNVKTYIMPVGYSSILRGYYLFENQVMNYNINNYRDWESLILRLSKKNTTGIIQLDLMNNTYYLLMKAGNLFLRPDMINNQSLIVCSYYFTELITEKLKNNARGMVSVFGIDNKELDEKMRENDVKHSLVKELEVKEMKGVAFGGASISISQEIIDFWISSLQTTQFFLKIEGLEERINVAIKRDPKLSPDVIVLPSSVMQKIKIRDRRIMNGEKIAVYPELL
ncbi:MAG: hypothetical protein ABDH21_04665 [bacterium]